MISVILTLCSRKITRSLCIFTAVMPVLAQDNLQLLDSPQRKQREVASADLLQWSSQNAEVAVHKLLAITNDCKTPPEARERAYQSLKQVAILEYKNTGEGYLGIGLGMQVNNNLVPGLLSPRPGITINTIADGSAAARAGLLPNDILVGMNNTYFDENKDINEPEKGLLAIIRKAGAGKEIVLGIMRLGVYLPIIAKLDRRPAVLQNAPQQRVFGAGQIIIGGFAGNAISKEDMQALALKDQDEYFTHWLAEKLSKVNTKK